MIITSGSQRVRKNRQGVVCRIKCSNCQVSYIGETGRNLTERLTECKGAARFGDANNHIAKHHQSSYEPHY